MYTVLTNPSRPGLANRYHSCYAVSLFARKYVVVCGGTDNRTHQDTVDDAQEKPMIGNTVAKRTGITGV